MSEKHIFLRSAIHEDMDAIAAIYIKLEQNLTHSIEDEDTLIVRAYHLHSLYSAFENIFQNVAAKFENSIDDQGRWHSQLVERMKLDLMPIRPALLNQKSYDAIDELRRFRHMFRHAYSVQLDPYRLELVVRKAKALKEVYKEQMANFLHFVETFI